MQGVILLAFVTFGAGQISFDKKPKNNDVKSFPNANKSSNQLKSKHRISFGGSKPPLKDIDTKHFSLAELLNKEAPQSQVQTRFGFGSKVS